MDGEPSATFADTRHGHEAYVCMDTRHGHETITIDHDTVVLQSRRYRSIYDHDVDDVTMTGRRISVVARAFLYMVARTAHTHTSHRIESGSSQHEKISKEKLDVVGPSAENGMQERMSCIVCDGARRRRTPPLGPAACPHVVLSSNVTSTVSHSNESAVPTSRRVVGKIRENRTRNYGSQDS